MSNTHLKAVNKVKDNNPFRIKLMGKKYTGVRAALWDVGLLNPKSKLNKKINKKVNSISAKLKNTWKEYKAGNIKGTVPHAWEKSGINTISSNLKNINKRK